MTLLHGYLNTGSKHHFKFVCKFVCKRQWVSTSSVEATAGRQQVGENLASGLTECIRQERIDLLNLASSNKWHFSQAPKRQTQVARPCPELCLWLLTDLSQYLHMENTIKWYSVKESESENVAMTTPSLWCAKISAEFAAGSKINGSNETECTQSGVSRGWKRCKGV